MDTVGILWATKDATVVYFLAQETKGSDTDRFWANLSPITFPEIKGGVWSGTLVGANVLPVLSCNVRVYRSSLKPPELLVDWIFTFTLSEWDCKGQRARHPGVANILDLEANVS